MKLRITKDTTYTSKHNRKIYISINNFNFILTQSEFVKYILAFLLALKNYNTNICQTSILTNTASKSYDFYLKYDFEKKMILLKHKKFKFMLSIEEFISICNHLENELDEIIDFHGYTKNDFDIVFLYSCADRLLDIKSIAIVETKLFSLYGNIHSDFGSEENKQILLPLKNVPAYKYLKGDQEQFIHYKQYNYLCIDNENRLKNTLYSIVDKGYPLNNNYIITHKGSNSIRDGLHRASVLAHLYGLDHKIPIMQIDFMKSRIQYDSVKNLEFSKSFNLLEKQILALKKKYRKIAIYGYGKIGKFIETKIENVVIIADIDYQKINQYNVCHPDLLNEYQLDCIIIAVLGREAKIKAKLHTFLNSHVAIETLNV